MQLRVGQLLAVIRSDRGQIKLPEVAHHRHIGGLKDVRDECEPNEVNNRPQRAIDDPRGNEGLFDFLQGVGESFCVRIRAQSKEQEVLLG